MRPWKCIVGTAGASLLLAAGFCVFPSFAALWHAALSRPFAALAASISERFPFPLLEPLALALLLCAAAGFFRGWKRGLVRLAAILSALLSVYVLAWLPGYFVPMENFPAIAARSSDAEAQDALSSSQERSFAESSGDAKAQSSPASSAQPPQDSAAQSDAPSSAELEALCLRLIDDLNSSSLRFSGGKTALAQATSAMNAAFGAELSKSAVRFARYPEWMAALGLSGFYSPWTGEALVSPNLSAAALPFTACHELAHRLGMADEGAANIAAWIACRRAGGELADSAALWALRYAMAELRTSDESAWRRCAQQMRPALVRTFSSMNGFAEPAPARALFSPAGTGDYAALIPWLLSHSEELE